MTQERYRTELFGQLEALLMVSDEPMTLDQLTKATGEAPEILEATLKAIQLDYDGETSGISRGFQLRHVAGGWRLFTRAEHAEVITAFMIQGGDPETEPSRFRSACGYRISSTSYTFAGRTDPWREFRFCCQNAVDPRSDRRRWN